MKLDYREHVKASVKRFPEERKRKFKEKSFCNYVSNNHRDASTAEIHYSMKLLYTEQQWRDGEKRPATELPMSERCPICTHRERMSSTRPICRPCFEFVSDPTKIDVGESATPLGKLIQMRRLMVLKMGRRAFYEAVFDVEGRVLLADELD